MPLPKPPYYAVIFRSQRTPGDAGYGVMADRMVELAAQQPGFLAVDSVHDTSGAGITVSYWSSLESIHRWRDEAEHRLAQAHGREQWYASFSLEICRVESAREWTKPADRAAS